MILQKHLQLLFALTLLFFLSWLGWSFKATTTLHERPIPVAPDHENGEPNIVDPHPELSQEPSQDEVHSTLQSYGLDIASTASIQYAKIELDAVPEPDFHPPLLQSLPLSLPTTRQLSSLDDFNKRAPERYRAKVPITPALPPAQADNLIFGVATSISRLEESLDQFSHWASNNGARIFVLIPADPALSPESSITRTAEKAASLNLNITIIPSPLDTNSRYFHLVQTLQSHAQPGVTEWAVLIDDDTFFPSIARLQALLSKHTSPLTTPYYVGSLSEDLFQLGQWGIMAYGGAGIFLSMPLIDQLNIHYEPCATSTSTGDRKLSSCIFQYTTTKLTHETQLHQVDLKDDASGFYEALRDQPISIHHWKTWYKHDMVSAALVSRVCSETCLFQKYRVNANGEDWQLTNGFSLVQYTHNRGPDDVRMERTWRPSMGQNKEGNDDEMWRHSLSPLKPRDQGKIQYLLEKAVVGQDNTGKGGGEVVRQFYVRRKWGDEEIVATSGNGEEESENQSQHEKIGIIEVVWRRGGSDRG